MKKVLFAVLFLVLFVPSVIFAAGSSVTVTPYIYGDKIVLSCEWVSDSAAGTASGTLYASSPASYNTTYSLLGYFLYSVETDPGATAPSDNYTVTITDGNNLDMCAGDMTTNRDAANTEMVDCVSATQPRSIVRGNMTLSIAAAGNSKVGTTILTFTKSN